MRPKIFDIHSHLNFRDFDKDRENVIKQMQENGIWTICVGADKKTSQECVELAEKYENIFASVGLHPTDSDEKFSVDFYRELTKHPKVVAIGEIGLDYYRIKNQELRIKQVEIFKKQIELALETNKPLIIHCRDAHDDLIKILNTYYLIHNTNLRGNIHFFSGVWEQAKKYFNLGFSISFAGPITFTDQYDEIIKNAPLDKIMIETDSPFAAPAPYRGKRNEPGYVIEIAKKLAEIKKLPLEEIIKQTVINAEKFLSFDDLITS
ncbi:MAG: TatD family hydrolase [Patescibacteria group bacterium]